MANHEPVGSEPSSQACEPGRFLAALQGHARSVRIERQPEARVAPTRPEVVLEMMGGPQQFGAAIGGRYWDRTSDPCRVKAVLSR
jgi:hypothetical protein